MSDQAPSAPAPEASAAPEASNPAIEENQGQDNELEALEQEFDSNEEGAKAEGEPQAAAPKEQVKADKAAKQEGAKKVDDDKYKIKVDGEEVELSREEMVKYAQMGRSGQKKMQEAAQVRQEAIKLVEMLKANPEKVLADPAILGSDDAVLKFAQKILANRMEEESKDPALRDKERLEKELESLRAEKKQEEEKRKQDDYQRMVQEEETALEEGITQAFESSGLPKSPFVLKRLADVLISGAEAGKKVTPQMAMNIVKREMQKDLKDYFDTTPEDVLEGLINADKVKNLRKRQLSKLKESAKAAAPSLNDIKEAAKPLEPKNDAPTKVRMKDWLRR
jgi:hypothetical protein